jgi:hypothetical protein
MNMKTHKIIKVGQAEYSAPYTEELFDEAQPDETIVVGFSKEGKIYINFLKE